jgi:hypothetical protein
MPGHAGGAYRIRELRTCRRNERAGYTGSVRVTGFAAGIVIVLAARARGAHTVGGGRRCRALVRTRMAYRYGATDAVERDSRANTFPLRFGRARARVACAHPIAGKRRRGQRELGGRITNLHRIARVSARVSGVRGGRRAGSARAVDGRRGCRARLSLACGAQNPRSAPGSRIRRRRELAARARRTDRVRRGRT